MGAPRAEHVARSFSVPPEPRQLSLARSILEQVATEAGFSDERVFDIKVACSEAVANAIEHVETRGEVTISTLVLPDRLEVQIEGPGRMRPPGSSEERTHRGLGLPLMATLADHLALYTGPRGGTLVSLTFYCAGAQKKEELQPLPPSIQALVEENALFSAIAANSPVGICVLDSQLRYLWVNQAYKGFLDEPYRSIDLTGLRLAEVLPGAGEAGVLDGLREVSETGKIRVDEEYKLVWPQRGSVWLRRQAVPLLLETSKPPFDLLVVVSDITARKEAEAARRESERKYQALIETNVDFVWEMDPHGRYTYCSPQMQALWAIRPQDMIGKTPFELMPPQERQRAAGLFADLLQSPAPFRAQEGTSYDGQGRTIFIETSGVPFFDDHGNLGGYRGITRDITERRRTENAARESEERFRVMADCSPIMVWTCDPDGRLEYVNRAYCDYFGVVPDDIASVQWGSLVHPDDAPAYLASFTGSLRSRTVFEARARVRREDGAWRWVHSYGAPRFSSTGEYLGIVGSSPDITERVQAEEALETSRRRAELLARTAGELLTSTDPQTMVEGLCREVMAELDCHVFFNFLAEEEGARLRLNAYAGIPEEEARSIEWLDFGVAVCGCVAASACPIIVEEIPSTSDPRTQLVASYGVKAYACHPLMYESRLLGTLSFGTRSRSRFSEADLSVMRAVTDQVAIAMARIQGEQALRESRRALERAQAVAETGSWWLDLSSGRLSWSDEARRIFGVPAGTTLTYAGFLDLVHAEDRAQVGRAWDAALAGAPYDIEHRIVTQDGVKWVREIAEIDRDECGRLLGGFGIVHDITKRKESEEALRAALERQALAQKAAMIGFWDWDMTTGRLTWSPEFHDLLGLSQTADASFDTWLAVVHPDDRDRAMERITQSLEDHVTLESEYRVLLSDRAERWIEAIGDATYDSDGRPISMCGICMDITERKQAEAERERLLVQEQALAAGAYARSLIEASLDPLVTIGPDGKITDVNEATIKITGWTREELVGTDFSDYFADPESARRGYRRVFAEGAVMDYPLTVRDKNGRLTEVLYNASVFRDESGNVAGVFAAARDMTAIRELEEQRVIAQKLQQALLDIPEHIDCVEFSHLYRSATKEAAVGGDFYDVFRMKHGRVGVLIGDVSGHGVEAARIATLVKDVVHAFAHQTHHPKAVLGMTNDLLIEKGISGFVTLFLGCLDADAGRLEYSSAGHPRPLLRRASGNTEFLGAGSVPVGVFPDASWKEASVQLETNSVLLLYTDGVTDARRNHAFFGEEGLVRAFSRWSDRSPALFPQALLDEVLAFTDGELSDDVAILAVSLTGDMHGKEAGVKEVLRTRGSGL